MQPSERGLPCPWCLAVVDLMSAGELRQLVARRPAQLALPGLDWFAADFPAWWCPRCHHGGMLFGRPG